MCLFYFFCHKVFYSNKQNPLSIGIKKPYSFVYLNFYYFSFSLILFKTIHFPELQYSKFVQPNTKLTGIFLDPLGYHLLLAFAARNKDGNPELVYLHRRSSKLKSVTKSRNYEVTEVGWNNENTSEITTGPILLGTSQGHILETELEADSDKMFTANQQYWRQVI